MNKLNPTVKIGRRNALTQKIADNSENLSTKKNKVEPQKDQVSLSQTSKVKASIQGPNRIASDMRYDLIKKYRDILDNGTYVVKAEELADKIVQKIRENKNRMVI